jgi:hypothetical protein
MPYRNKEDKLAAQRRWYAANREKVIAKVAERKRTLYAGVCRNCGGPTMGSTKNNIPEWCGKPQCRSMQLRVRYWGPDPPPRANDGNTNK